ncbi:MAG: glycosyl transferase [Verrucomicrobiota bacterium]
MKIPGLGWLHYRFVVKPRADADAQACARELPALQASIRQLPPLSASPEALGSAPEVNMLTGEKFLYLTVFSAYSLVRAAGRPFRICIVSDGTVSPASLDLLRQIFPGMIVYRAPAEEEARVEALFPLGRFPALRRARVESVFFRKLLDVHGGAQGWRLYLDSDTFFHRRPDVLLDCIAAGDRPCYMLDQWSNYGHPLEFLEKLSGRPMLRKANAGIVGLRSETIDWERMEHWLAQMRQAGGDFFYFEQGLTAMLLSAADSVLLPPEDYIIGPHRAEVLQPRGVFHHYAGESKNRFVGYRVPRVLFAA